MDPITTKGYAQARGFQPATAPNTAEQQRQRDKEFIRQYQEVKNIELNQEAAALARLKENNRIEQQNREQFNRQSEAYEQQRDKLELQKLEREYEAQKTVTGMNAKDQRFNDALELVKNLSTTAVELGTKLNDQHVERVTEEVKANLSELKATGMIAAEKQLGGKQLDNAKTGVEFAQDSAATEIERRGKWNMGAHLKGRSPLYKTLFTKGYAASIGSNFGPEELAFLGQQQSEDPTVKYLINGEEQEIGNLDLGDPAVTEQLLRQRIAVRLKDEGLDGYNNVMLAGFYDNTAQSITQTVGTIRNAQISEQKLDRQDKAKSIFRMDPTPLNFKLLQNTLTKSGLSEKQARDGAMSQTVSLSDEDFEAIGDMPYGPNGMPYREQYPGEWQTAVTRRNAHINAKREAVKFEMEAQDEQLLLELQSTVLEEIQDGTFDADPATLTQIAENADLQQAPKAAAYARSLIPLTKSKMYDKSFLDQLKLDMEAGISNYSAKQIMQNSSLSSEAKREALSMVQNFEQTAVPADVKTADWGIIKQAIKDRAGVNEFGGKPGNLSVKIMQQKAWDDYREVYSKVLSETQSPSAARSAAMDDFNARFNDEKGKYRVVNALDDPSKAGTYVNGRLTPGKAYNPSTSLNEVKINFESKGASAVLTSSEEMYTGEKQQLTDMLAGAPTGKIAVPSVFYEIQQQSGGKMSMRQLLTQRLQANGLEGLPEEIGELASEVEMSFDPRYKKFVNYRPNPIRTDIAVISTGNDPIYTNTMPNNVAGDQEFKAAVEDVSQRLQINPTDLYAVIGFETGGTFDPAIRNGAGSGATGLIQFTADTAAGLGTSVELLAGMSRARQMHYVEKHFRSVGLKPGASRSDLYMAVLFPAAVGKPDDYVLFGKGAMSGFEGIAYDQNSGLDKNGDGSVTKAEAASKIVTYRDPTDTGEPWRQPKNMNPALLGAE